MPPQRKKAEFPYGASLALLEDDDDDSLAPPPPARAPYPTPEDAGGDANTGYGWEPDFGPATYYKFYGKNEKFHATLEEDGSYQMDQNAKHKPKLEGEALAEAKRKAWARGVPISKQEDVLSAAERFADHDKISLVIVSEMHKESEYGIERTPEGGHCGGPFRLKVSPECTVRDLMLLIRDAAGIMPGLQKLSYRGVHMDDLYRRLEQYGVAYWHKKFPDWPITIRNQ